MSHPSQASRPNTLRAFTALLLLACLSLVSCGSVSTDTIDPSFASYEALVEANPSPKAIVGLWHRSDARSFGTMGTVDTKSSTTMLLRPDGTALIKNKALVGSTLTDLPPVTGGWKYLGHGTWANTGGATGTTSKFRLAGDKLLIYGDSPLGAVRVVYTRVK